MSTLIVYTLAGLVVLAVVALLALIGYRLWAKYVRGDKSASNNIGTFERLTCKALAALPVRNLLVAIGVNQGEVTIGTAALEPLGVATDEADIDDLVAVEMLGIAPRTLLLTAGAAVDVGDQLVAAADGKVIALPATNGTYYIVGTALSPAGADGDVVNVLHRAPVKVTVTG